MDIVNNMVLTKKKLLYILATGIVTAIMYNTQSAETTRRNKDTLNYFVNLIKSPPDNKGENAPGMFLEISAIRGNPKSQYKLGAYYLEQKPGNIYDPLKGEKWMRFAAGQNYAPAQLWLGNMYHLGHGVAKDTRQAAVWYLKAANNGNSTAQSNLGVLYMTGDGVKQDVQQAVT